MQKGTEIDERETAFIQAQEKALKTFKKSLTKEKGSLTTKGATFARFRQEQKYSIVLIC